jgi:predicted  nucleic acid-binding Zn-ribbon protein
MSRSDLQTSIQKQEGLMTRAENKFDAHVRVLQRDYDIASRDHEKLSAQMKRQLKFYKELALAQASAGMHEEL